MNEHNQDHATDEERLVAYLDGELSPDEATAVEKRLGRDESFRSILAGLQGAWDLLDSLPQPTVDEAFTQTTVEMVAVKLSETTEFETTTLQRRKRLRSLAFVVGGAACLALGFLGTRHFQSRQDRELLRDLPLIEKIDQYTEVEDLEFLVTLYESGLFIDESIGEEARPTSGLGDPPQSDPQGSR